MGEFSAWHWLIVAVALVALFGANKLPQLARSVGQSARIFKAETRGLADDEKTASTANGQSGTGKGAAVPAKDESTTAKTDATAARTELSAAEDETTRSE